MVSKLFLADLYIITEIKVNNISSVFIKVRR